MQTEPTVDVNGEFPRGTAARNVDRTLMSLLRIALRNIGPFGVTLGFAIAAWRMRWMSDDGFINLRIVRNILNGDGFVFNLGERVEASSSPAWVGLLSVLGVTGIELEYLAVYTGILLSIVAHGFAVYSARTIDLACSASSDKPTRRIWFPMGIGIYCVLTPAWEFSSSGMETSLSLAWLSLSMFLLARLMNCDSRNQESYPSTSYSRAALVIGFGPVIRPDLGLYFVGFLFVIVAAASEKIRNSPTLLAKIISAALFVPFSYQIFRMGYFGNLVPNTVLVKESLQYGWHQGWIFAKNLLDTYWLICPLVIYFVSLAMKFKDTPRYRVRLLIAVPVICGILNFLFYVMIGGGFMHARLLLPSLYAILIPIAVIPLRRNSRRYHMVLQIAGVTVMTLWMILCAWQLRFSQAYDRGIVDERAWYVYQSNRFNPILVADFQSFVDARYATKVANLMSQQCPYSRIEWSRPDCERMFVGYESEPYPLNTRYLSPRIKGVLDIGSTGIVGYGLASHIYISDNLGLSDTVGAHMKATRVGEGRPGHEKLIRFEWLMARFALPSFEESIKVQFARKALECGKLSQLIHATTAELTLSQFFSNFRNSYRTYAFRISRDPEIAYEELCRSVS